jgi:hypothetical protein
MRNRHQRGVVVHISWISSLRRLAAAFLFAVPMLASAQGADKQFTNEQLDQMLAQIALYPDSLLSQVLMASTYPVEFQEAAAWSKANPNEKGDEAVTKVQDKDWDTAVASLVAFPEVLVTLGEKPDYVKSLGDAFLAQPEDVMDSVQRLRAAAQKAGNLKSNEQIKVSTEAPPPPRTDVAATSTTTVVQAPPVTQTIIIEPAQPQVVYVPSYNPTVVYGPWWYPSYPPYYYPPPPGYWWSRPIATGIAWGVGIGVSHALWGGCNWGHRDIDIDIDRHNSINVNKRIDVDSKRSSWSHKSEHRKTSYRGGDAQKQRLENKRASNDRQQFRGKDGASRDASRERAQSAMQSRGVDTPSGSARDRAQQMSRDGGGRDAAQQRAQSVDRSAAQQRAQSVDRDAARQRAQSADRSAAQQRAQSASRDSALKGAGSSNARAEQARGAASAQRASASRPSGGGGASRPSGGGGGGARAGGGGGGGARGGGGGGRGR